MKLQTLNHSPALGFSEPPDASLDSAQTLVLMFGGAALIDAPQAIQQIVAAFPKSCLLGCSTSGEIFGTQISDGTLAVAVARFDRTTLKAASSVITADSSFEAGQTLGRALDGPGLRAVLILSDGLQVNGSELVRGVNSVLAASVAVTGGLAGDGDRFQRTWVMHGGSPQGGQVTAVGMYGEALRVGHGSKGGWDVFGVERTVTRAKANVLYELDGRPALALYKEYLGERASGLPATGLLFPLSLRAPGDDAKRLVRTILGVDEAAQSLTFAGDVPEGYFAQLMCANFDRLVQGAGEAALSARQAEAGDSLMIAISCVGRRLVLGDHCEEEIEATSQVLAAGAKQVGFYSYGEISPFASGHCDLHNQTMTLTTLSEAAL